MLHEPFERRERAYLFYGVTRALCSRCLMVCDAKELIEGEKVYLLKRCLEHGLERVLLSDDLEYFRLCRQVYLKAPELVERHNTGVEFGCPYDCGICPDHEQHGCVSVLEVTDHCNLRCPTCYAASGPDRLTHRTMATLRSMLDRIVANEGHPDVLQISGGEPTVHPEILEILAECRARPIRHLMLNTNGLRIAREPAFVDALASQRRGFEVYLQFDSLRDASTRTLRGADLAAVRLQALERLDAAGISTTLVMTVKRGVNDGEIGDVLRFASTVRCVRGVTIQPIEDAGRCEAFDPAEHRLTLSEVRRRVYEQFPTFSPADVVPVPCDPDCVAMAYGIRGDGDAYTTIEPLTRYVPANVLLEGGKNTIIYEGDRALVGATMERVFAAFSTGHSPESSSGALQRLLCCLPTVRDAPGLTYERVFRVIVMQFLDRWSLDLRAVRKSCVHVAHPDGRRVIPFDAYNLFYRDDLEETVLAPLRARVAAGRAPSAKGRALPLA